MAVGLFSIDIALVGVNRRPGYPKVVVDLPDYSILKLYGHVPLCYRAC